ncbi:MAG: transposase [Burkholderiales bacterium]
MLLKVVLFAYSQGIISSRGMKRACREHITFIALSGDSAPHFTPVANFVSTLSADIAQLFAQGLYLCARQGRIGRGCSPLTGLS